MVRAWLMDESTEDQRLPHMTDPPQILDAEAVTTLTGCQCLKLDPDNFRPELEKIRTERGYTYQDVLDLRREVIPDYDEKLKGFYTEHIHSDEEIRYCAEGSGYFDIRDKDDRWIRMEIQGGDLIILPGGIYHRFTLDKRNYVKLLRFFIGQPVWTSINRPADDHPARKAYVQTLLSKG